MAGATNTNATNVFPNEAYPALFRCADESANRMQRFYLSLIRAEYVLIFIAAVFSMEPFGGAAFYTIYAMIFVLSIGTLLTRTLKKPEQDWYKCRALAESAKTLTWRYMMHASPFESAAHIKMPEAVFRDHLQELITSNRNIAEKIDPRWADADQITPQINSVRVMMLNDRKEFYARERVANQREWYAKKAECNRKAAIKWVAIGIIAYFTAGVLALVRISFPDWRIWPIEPVLVVASSVIGWMQIKKFNELSAAYTVTAHEIGLITPIIQSAQAEDEFSHAVNEAELAFSREHTLWIARQAG